MSRRSTLPASKPTNFAGQACRALLLVVVAVFGLGVRAAQAAPPVLFAADPVLTDHAAPGRIEPLAARNGLRRPKEEKAVRLETARVVLADYPLIKHDFGKALETRFAKPLATISHDEIDTWLLDSTAYISTPQAKQTTVNTPVPHTERSVTALRPADYGRALVFQPAPGVLIDVKGSGALAPEQEDHANGLATLGEAIREYAYEHLVHKVFEHSKSDQRTVGHYAVIDAGIDVKHPDGRTDPAGLILRQAHRRATGDLSALNDGDTKRVEMTLRRYGITSAGAYQNEPYDLLNLQGTADGAVLDFGGFLVMPKFEKPAYHFDRSPEKSPKFKPLLSARKNFVQPDDDLRVPVELWGFTVSGRPDPVVDNPQLWSHELATSLRNGKATRSDAEQHMRNLLDPVDARLQAHPMTPDLQGKAAWMKRAAAAPPIPRKVARSIVLPAKSTNGSVGIAMPPHPPAPRPVATPARPAVPPPRPAAPPPRPAQVH